MIVTNPGGPDTYCINNDIFGKNWMRYGFAIPGHPDSFGRDMAFGAQQNEEASRVGKQQNSVEGGK